MMHTIQIKINGAERQLTVESYRTLLDVIRNDLGLTGTKAGCGTGDCGACSVIMDGKIVNACLILAPEADGSEILTIEGLSQGNDLHPIQQAFIDYGAVQCGYCTPGLVLAVKALLDENPCPSDEFIRDYIAGNLCRCTGYQKIVEAAKSLCKSKAK